jgi:cell division protein FtsQ
VHRIRSITAAGPAEVTLFLRGGVTVLWGAADKTAAKAREMKILLRTKSRYYDVSDPITAVTGASASQSG